MTKLSARIITITLLCLCALLSSLFATSVHADVSGSRPKTYCNPLDLPYRFSLEGDKPYREGADPTLVAHKGEYWLFVSKSGGYWHSKDLVTWDFIVPADFPTEEYAPTVVVVGDQWLLLTSPSHALYATDDPATGKWKKIREVPSVNDPMLFLDDDGRLYLYSGSSPDKPIVGVELDTKNDFVPIGETKPLIPVLDQLHHGWEARNQFGSDEDIRGETFLPWMEGVWMTKHKETYYLQYAAPATESKVYADGVYTSDKPLGDFKYAPYNPFSYKPTGFAASAGHSSMILADSGRHWRVSTMFVGVRHWFDRRLGFFPAGFVPNGSEPDQLVTNTYLADYPQLAPGVAKNPLSDNLAGWMLVSLKKNATASSTLDAEHKVEKAFDEDMTTSWAAATGDVGEWLQVDLGKPCRVDAVQINFADINATAHGRLAEGYRYTLEMSDDGKTWVTLLDRKEKGRDAPHEYVQLPAAVSMRYARLTNVYMPSGAVFSISGLRFFGSGLGEAPKPVEQVKAERQPNRRLMNVRWEKSPGADFYVVRYGIAPDRMTLHWQVYEGQSVTIPGLNTDREYFVSVDAVNDSGITKGGIGQLAAASTASLIAKPIPFSSDNGDGTFRNPLIYADVPDPSIIRVDDTFYMVSTTMHYAPGIPVMKSKDLVNWEIVSYCYDQIDRGDAFSLKNGKNDYAAGSWASNIRYDARLKRFFVINACNTTNKSYLFSTDNIEAGRWRCDVVEKCYDPGMLFDGDRRYVFYGQNGHHYREILIDPFTFAATLGPEKTWKKPMSFDGHDNWVEGAHAFKRGEYYYLPVIELRERRVQTIWRGKDLSDPAPWEARKIFSGDIRDSNGTVVLPSTGIAQGSLVDTRDGKWYALLFQDTGAVGRIPVLIPVDWTADGWPVLGKEGASVDEVMPMPVEPQAIKSTIVASDEFDNGPTRHTFSDRNADSVVNAGLSLEALREIKVGHATGENLIVNGDFEAGDIAPWTVNGGDELARLAIAPESASNRTLCVGGRKSTIAGPSQNLGGKLHAGEVYRISARIRYDDYTDTAGQRISPVAERNFKLTLSYRNHSYAELAVGLVEKGKWSTIQGAFTAPQDIDVADPSIFFETTWVSTDRLPALERTEKHAFDFQIDDVTLMRDANAEAIAHNEFGYNGSNLKLQWQWNHNPNNNLWSLTDRPGHLRLKSGLIAEGILDARNTLTQRTFGPASSATTKIDVSLLQDGDCAGIAAFQNQYGFVGVAIDGGKKSIVMRRADRKDDAVGRAIESIPLEQDVVYLRASCDFGYDKKDLATFDYSYDGVTWVSIGDTLHMAYDWPHFVGYRFGLFYFSTQQTGGCADFDFFHISNQSD